MPRFLAPITVAQEYVTTNETISGSETILGSTSGQDSYWTTVNVVSGISADHGSFVNNVSAVYYYGNGSNLTNLNASNISSGTLSTARLPVFNGDIITTLNNTVSTTVIKLQGNPISTSTPANGQILQWNGTAWVPGSISTGGSGGGGVTYYFNYANTTGISPTSGLPTSPVAPSLLGREYSVGESSIQSVNLTEDVYTLVAGFVTLSSEPAVTNIPAGIWDFNIWVDIVGNSSVNQTSMQIRVYKYISSTSTYTPLASSGDLYIYDPTVIAPYIASVTMPQTTILSSDRIYIEFWAAKSVNQSRAIRFWFDSIHPSHVHTTIPSVAGSGLVKTVNGGYQTPASLLVDVDVASNAQIAQSKISGLSTSLAGKVNTTDVIPISAGGTGQANAAAGLLALGGFPISGGTITDGLTASSGTFLNYLSSQSISGTHYGDGSHLSNMLGSYVKVVGVDASTIQSCIDLCLSANSDQNYTVFVPPGVYKENLTLKPSVALIGLGGTLNTLGSVISGYHSITLTEPQATNNRFVLQDILFQNNNETQSTIVVAGSSIGQMRANGCYFSMGGISTTGNHLSTSDNKSVYLDNCRFDISPTNNSGTHIIQGNGPLYLFNTNIYGGGRCIDLRYSGTTTRVCTISGYSSTNPIIIEGGLTTTGLSVGMKVVGTGINGTQSIISEITSLTSFKVNTGTSFNSYALSSTLTFGQTPYGEIHNSDLYSNIGPDVVRVGNGLFVGNNVNFTNTNVTGHGLYLSAGAVAGLAFSTFVISSSAAPYYAINGQAGSYFIANGISYSSSAIAAYNTSVNPLVTQFQYTGLTTSIANGGTGSTTAAGALTSLGAVPTTRTISSGTGLAGGGDLSTNRTLTVSYGSTSTTACVGNDSRLSDARSISYTTVPATSGATGTTGAVARDTNYLYVCVATNTWKRTPLTGW